MDGGGTATYSYDAEGERVTAVTAAGESEFLRDLNGQQVTWILNGVYQHTNVYAGSELIATWNGAMFYHYRDWLGSSRVQTDSAAYATAVCTNLPYGETNCAGTNVTQQGFTGWEYDPETGLHYAHARYYNNRLGRFMTADPLDGDIRNPQSLNRYAYVGGDPINFRDSNGMLGSDFGSAISGLPSGGLSTVVLGFVDFLGDLFGFGDDGPPFTGTLNPPPAVPQRIGGDFPNGESLGIPTGMKLPQLSIWQTIGIVPITPGCEFGTCGTMGSPYTDPNPTAGGEDGAEYTFHTYVWQCASGYCVLMPQAANNGHSISASPPTKPRLSFASCMTGELINNFFGDKNLTFITGAIHIAAFGGRRLAGLGLPGPGWLYTAAMTAWDARGIGGAYVTCKQDPMVIQ